MEKFKSDYRRAGSFSISEREQIVREYLSGIESKSEIWYRYTGSYQEHGNINRWLKQLGLEPQYCKYDFRREKSDTFVAVTPSIMPTTNSKNSSQQPKDLDRQIEVLKKELETEKLRCEGYKLMLEQAEKQLKVSILKKSGTK